MQLAKQTRLGQIFSTRLRQVRWRLGLAALCTLGVGASDLLKPWPLKLILEHGRDGRYRELYELNLQQPAVSTRM